MSNPFLLLQIVYPNGDIFQFPAGGILEIELENRLADRLLQKGVGLLRTSQHVEQDFRQAFQEVMYEFKDRVKVV